MSDAIACKGLKINAVFKSNRMFSCKLLLWCDLGEGPT